MKRVGTTNEIAWRDITIVLPEFVQWIAQTHGPLPEMADQETYNKYRTEYDKETSTQ